MEIPIKTLQDVVDFILAQHTLRRNAVSSDSQLRANLSHHMRQCYQYLNPYDRLEQCTANENFKAGMRVAEASGAAEDSLMVLYQAYLEKSFEDNIAKSLIAAAMLLWEETGGTFASLSFNVRLPYHDECGNPDDMFTMDLDELAECFDEHVSFNMSNLTDVQEHRIWLLSKLTEHSRIMSPVFFAIASLQTLFSLVENIGLLFSLSELVTYRLYHDQLGRTESKVIR